MPQAEKATKKPIPNFEDAVEALCLKYGYSDWAFVVRKPDRSAKGWWVAGEGKDAIDDRERALLILAEFHVLQDTITAHLKNPPPL